MAAAFEGAATAAPLRADQEVSLARLYVLRGFCLFYVLSAPFDSLPRLFVHAPDERGMITSILGGLWVMALIGLRYPLQILPIFLFECAWKTIWAIFFGLPQWLSGVGSPRLGEDLFSIGFFAIVFALLIPWSWVWRHYVRQPADRWR
jgi:hypothetical protein